MLYLFDVGILGAMLGLDPAALYLYDIGQIKGFLAENMVLGELVAAGQSEIFTWRGNGDGINPFGNGLIEDCFIRTQDDSSYVNGRGIRRVVFWNDYNGSTFVLSALPDRALVVDLLRGKT